MPTSQMHVSVESVANYIAHFFFGRCVSIFEEAIHSSKSHSIFDAFDDVHWLCRLVGTSSGNMVPHTEDAERR